MTACAPLTTPRVAAPARTQRPPLAVKGGYLTMPLVQAALASWCLRERHISLLEFRTWWAAHVALKNHGFGGAGCGPRYTIDELAGLTGGDPRRTRTSINRLNALGLLTWSETAIGFPGSADALNLPERDGFASYHAGFPNADRTLVVPRPAARLIASTRCRGTISTVIALLIHCLLPKDRVADGLGRCKAGWIVWAFGVSLRSVRDARDALIRDDWIRVWRTSQAKLNECGSYQRINLDWACPERFRLRPVSHPCPPNPPENPAPDFAPPGGQSAPDFARPLRNQNLPQGESKDQNPGADPGPPKTWTGFSFGDGGRKAGTKKPHPGGWHIEVDDLRDDDRLMASFNDGVRRGVFKDCRGDLEWWFDVAERSLDVGDDPAALAAGLVRKRLRSHVTQGQEEAGRRRLKAHEARQRPALPTADPRQARGGPPPLPADAQVLREIRGRLGGVNPDRVFCELRKQDPTWTRPRFLAASKELDYPRAAGPRTSMATLNDGGGLAAFAPLLGFAGRPAPPMEVAPPPEPKPAALNDEMRGVMLGFLMARPADDPLRAMAERRLGNEAGKAWG